MKKPYFWTTISVLSVMGVTVGPWFALFINSAVMNKLSVSSAEDIKSGCASVSNERCKGYLQFNSEELPLKGDIVFGVSTVPTHVYCSTEQSRTEILAARTVGYISIFSLPIQCNGKILSSIREATPLPPGAWLIPFSIQGSSVEVDRFLKSVLFYANDIRPFIAPLAIFQLILIVIIFKVFGIRQVFRYRYTFFLVSVMAIVNSGIIERLFDVATETIFSHLVLALAFGWAFTFFIESGAAKPKKWQIKLALYLSIFFGVISFFRRIP